MLFTSTLLLSSRLLSRHEILLKTCLHKIYEYIKDINTFPCSLEPSKCHMSRKHNQPALLPAFQCQAENSALKDTNSLYYELV